MRLGLNEQDSRSRKRWNFNKNNCCLSSKGRTHCWHFNGLENGTLPSKTKTTDKAYIFCPENRNKKNYTAIQKFISGE